MDASHVNLSLTVRIKQQILKKRESRRGESNILLTHYRQAKPPHTVQGQSKYGALRPQKPKGFLGTGRREVGGGGGGVEVWMWGKR